MGSTEIVSSSPKRELLELKLRDSSGGGAQADARIAAWRQSGWSWRKIAQHIERQYGFDASPEWYRDQFGGQS